MTLHAQLGRCIEKGFVCFGREHVATKTAHGESPVGKHKRTSVLGESLY
jgi:hypothetical protein